jgi:hypothetical protein
MVDLRHIDSDSLLLARTWEMRNHGASSGASGGLRLSKNVSAHICFWKIARARSRSGLGTSLKRLAAVPAGDIEGSIRIDKMNRPRNNYL